MENTIISLKNVSKFYYSKGVIASGFSKINLDFKMGEFIAITGESGSGKSTLLNVLSGLDTYEEGEMYINGEETSHYTEKDFEDYRRKYIGNIFQNFNLVNSYTVYQNIELVLLLNGGIKSEIKPKVLDLINKVDLYKFRNTKVSRLSGGQKQRVAIARALAKDTPVIIADEPTGNLDSDSAAGIIKLLSDIAKNKLVVIVTHNYEQVEEYVTRKIKLHDGKVLEDKQIKQAASVEENHVINYKNITFLNKVKLGVRNTFNIIPKFLLLFLVFLFVTVATMSEYSAFKKQEYLAGKSGYNQYFNELSDTRIVIKKSDGSSFSEEDFNTINALDNVNYTVKNDLLLDTNIVLSDNANFGIYGYGKSINNLKGGVDVGRLPQNDNEIVLEGSKDDYYLNHMKDDLLKTTLYLRDNYTEELSTDAGLTVVGIKYSEESMYSDSYYMTKIYLSEAVLGQMGFEINQQYSTLKILFENTYYNSDNSTNSFKLIPNSAVPVGKAYVSTDLNNYSADGSCLNDPLNIEVSNLYYNDTLPLTIAQTYSKSNMKTLLGVTDYETFNGAVYINPEDYNRLFNKGTYQSSLFVKDVDQIDGTINKLNDMGYTTLAMKNALAKTGMEEMMQMFKAAVTIILVIVLFFIAYFVINLILRSRNVYYSTIRMIGANKSTARDLLIIELLVVANLAFFLFTGTVLLTGNGIIPLGFMQTILDYLKFSDYAVLYVVLMLMSFLISLKYAKKLFKDSAMKTIKEEV